MMGFWPRWSTTVAVAALVVGAGLVSPAGPAAASPGRDVDTLPARPSSSRSGELVPGSTPERRAAWNRLTPQAQAQAIEKFTTLVGGRLSAEAAKLRPTTTPTAPVVTWRQAVAGQVPAAASAPTPTFTARAPQPRGTVGGPVMAPQFDADGDGLDQGFEAGVADAFTPYYHVSANERGGTGFATFHNFVPQTVAQVFGSVPPISYFRVQPLGFGTDSVGTPVGILRIDYLTLWNRDDGFELFGVCGAAIGLVESLTGIAFFTGGHSLDNERSAALVAAPIPPEGGYNTNPGSYSLYSFYTAAHEGVWGGDQSRYGFFSPPVPAGLHIELGLAKSKHGTYPFNPNWHPVIWPEIIAMTNFIISDLYFAGWISFEEYLIYLYLADEAFFGCLVEHFDEQGGFYAGQRIDVGEPSQPINGAGFIQDTQSGINQKFTVPLW